MNLEEKVGFLQCVYKICGCFLLDVIIFNTTKIAALCFLSAKSLHFMMLIITLIIQTLS